MTFREDLEAVLARCDELQPLVAERDRRIAELQAKLAEGALSERHAIQIRQLETAIAAARGELADLARLPQLPPPPPPASGGGT